MIGFRGELRVLVATRPIDFRRGVHGLVAMVAQALIGDPYCGDIFVFRYRLGWNWHGAGNEMA
jgi:transposase